MITGSEDRAFDLISIIDSVEGAPDGASASIEDVRVDHRCGDIPMTEQLLDGADVVAILKEGGWRNCGAGCGNLRTWEYWCCLLYTSDAADE